MNIYEAIGRAMAGQRILWVVQTYAREQDMLEEIKNMLPRLVRSRYTSNKVRFKYSAGNITLIRDQQGVEFKLRSTSWAGTNSMDPRFLALVGRPEKQGGD